MKHTDSNQLSSDATHIKVLILFLVCAYTIDGTIETQVL